MSNEQGDAAQWRERLSRDGYCIANQVLDQAVLESLRNRFNETTLAKESKDVFGDAGAFMKVNYHDPILVDLLTNAKALDILKALGYPHPKLHSYYISTKPAGSEALPWHSDLFYDYEKSEPAELFLIYYLQDTSPDNGCLRVVPSSHLWTRSKREEQPHMADTRTDEVDVPISAGDLFIGDRRILHATHANNSPGWRTCLTIAYAPDFRSLPEAIQSLIAGNQCLPPAGWQNKPETLDPRLQAILPIYERNR